MKVTPIHGRILVKEPVTENVTAGGIVIAGRTEQEPTIHCKVIDVHAGCVDIKPGDTVVITKHAGSNVRVNDELLLLVLEDQVLAVIDNG